MNVTIDPQALPYLIAVRERLAGMPTDDLDEIVSDLEQHLTEMISEAGEPLAQRLGSPDRYAEEFAQSAGWEVAEGVQRRLLDRVPILWTNLAMSAPGRWWARTWREFRPGWWVARGLVAPMIWIALYSASGLPEVLATIPAVILSVAVGRRVARGLAWRAADSIATIIAIWLLIAGGLNGIGVYDRDIQYTYLDVNPRGVVGQNGPITDFVSYDLGGNPVTVFLYDQRGQPVVTEVNERNPRLTVGGEPVFNLYPYGSELSTPIRRVPELAPVCQLTGDEPFTSEACIYPPR